MARVPKATGGQPFQRKSTLDSSVQSRPQTKADIIEKAGFTPKQVQRFETLAKHRDIVEQAKAEARENDDAGAKKVNAYKKKKALFFYRQNSTNSGIAANSIKINVIEIVSKTSRFMRLLGIKSSTLLTVHLNWYPSTIS